MGFDLFDVTSFRAYHEFGTESEFFEQVHRVCDCARCGLYLEPVQLIELDESCRLEDKLVMLIVVSMFKLVIHLCALNVE